MKNDEPPVIPDYLKQAQDIVDAALNDRAVYDEMCRKESARWSYALRHREESDYAAVLQEEQRAGASLGVGRNKLQFVQWAKQRGLVFDRALSLGCGAGRLERAWSASGIVRSFHGIDLAEGALDKARELAATAGLTCTYQQADLNFLKLPGQQYDFVVASTSLHHCLFLENIAEQIAHTLKPGGLLCINDYIGESQFQYTDERIALSNRLLKIIPEKYRYSRLSKAQLKPVKRPRLPLNSPFASIRSQDIPNVFLERFEVVEKRETVGIIQFVAPNGCRCSYAESDEGRALFEILMQLDELFIEKGIVTPTLGQYILRNRGCDNGPDSINAPGNSGS